MSVSSSILERTGATWVMMQSKESKYKKIITRVVNAT